MSSLLSKKLAEMLSRMDEKVVKAKLYTALDMLKKGNTEELAKKIKNVDKNELMEKLNEFDKSKIKEMNIDINEIKNQITNEDLARLANIIGERGDEVVRKIKGILDE